MPTSDFPHPPRCRWVPPADDLYVRYHDEEWGVALSDSHALFRLLCLEGQQAGLSWRTVLHRRDAYDALFDRFEPGRVARLTDRDLDRLAADPRLIRHRKKLAAIVANARAFLDLEAAGKPFSDHIWSFTEGRVLVGDGASPPVGGPEAAKSMSHDLRGRGFIFIGPTICYAFMQAAGLVMDHEAGCFRRLHLLPGRGPRSESPSGP